MPVYTFRCNAEKPHTLQHRGRMDWADAPTRCPLLTNSADPHSRCNAALDLIVSSNPSDSQDPEAWRWRRE